MFETLEMLLGFHGAGSKAVIWEHNSHLGDAAATEMGVGGQTNVGHLCRSRFGASAYLIGQGTDHGTVAAAANWDEPVEFMQVRPGYPGSYENLFHDRWRRGLFVRICANPARRTFARNWLLRGWSARSAWSIGRETEMASHYFHAKLSHQFDEFIWFDRTQAVSPISSDEARGLPHEHPFSLGA